MRLIRRHKPATEQHSTRQPVNRSTPKRRLTMWRLTARWLASNRAADRSVAVSLACQVLTRHRSAACGSDRSPAPSERIHSIAIIFATRIPSQMEFLAGTTTNTPARIFRSTRIAPTLGRFSIAALEESSPFQKSVACIIATNVSPPDSSRTPAHQSLRGLPHNVV